MQLSRDELLSAYRTMATARHEDSVFENFSDGKIPGFVHLSAGQEATAAGVYMSTSGIGLRRPIALMASASPAVWICRNRFPVFAFGKGRIECSIASSTGQEATGLSRNGPPVYGGRRPVVPRGRERRD